MQDDAHAKRSGRVTLRAVFCLALLSPCLLPSAASAGRPIRFHTLGPEEGLSQTQTFFVFQDSVGFIWLGSERGLNRYDGYRMEVFSHEPGNPDSIADDFTWAMSQDASGDLWIATEGGGIARWRRDEGRFTRYQNDPEDPASLASNRTRTVLVGHDGSVWVGTRDQGLDRLDPVTGQAEHFRHDPADAASLSHDAVYALHQDRDGRLLVGTDAGLDRFDPETGRFEHVVTGDAPQDRVRAVAEDAEGRVWLGTQGSGLIRLGTDGTVARFRNQPRDPSSLSHDIVRAVLADDSGRLWVATGNGLDLMREDGGFDHYRRDADDPHSLPDSSVISLYQDRGGVLWVGTQFGGVSRWNPATWSFGHHSAEATGLSGSSISAFAKEPSGRVWIGTYGQGLNRLDPESGAVEHFRHEPGNPRSLSDDSITALHLDPEGVLWIGTRVGGLNWHRLGTRGFQAYRHAPGDPDSLGSDAITALSGDGEGGLWIGTFGGGLSHLDRATGALTHYRHTGPESRSLSNETVLAIADDRDGRVWLGTYGGGLNHLDRTTGEVRHFRQRGEDPASLSDDTVYALHLDPEGTLWIGTRGAGLDRLVFDEAGENATFHNYSTRDGLVDGDVFGILPDDSGDLWLSTNGGLSRFDPRSETFESFRASSGLQSNEFNSGAHYRAPDGQLFFGGINGFNAFYPERLRRNTHAPQVVLTAFLKLNRPADVEGTLSGLERVRLGYRDDVVTFEFAALDFAAPEENRYRYRLVGFDADWVDAGEVHRVTYTNLSPGSYTFRVAASNNDGVWNENGLALPLTVEPPPWRTWWAYALYALALGGLGWAASDAQRRKTRRQEAYRRQLEHEVAARTQELRERNLELENLNVRLSEASLTDSLTGLKNRRFLFDQVASDAALILRDHLAGRDPTQLAFIMIDLDEFKPVNDTRGHAAGDRVLLQVRDILGKACRNSDVLIRWGGDEFLVVGREVDLASTVILPERIRAAVERHEFDFGDDEPGRLTCSIGVACYPFLAKQPEAVGLEQVVALADRALYAAKRGGRNAWVCVVANASTDPETLSRLATDELESLAKDGCVELRSSLADGRQLKLG